MNPDLDSPRRILIRAPEIRIKGRNRPSFREALKRNLGQRLRGIGLRWRASSAGDRIWIEVPPAEIAELDRALEAIVTVFGVELGAPGFRDSARSGRRSAPGGTGCGSDDGALLPIGGGGPNGGRGWFCPARAAPRPGFPDPARR